MQRAFAFRNVQGVFPRLFEEKWSIAFSQKMPSNHGPAVPVANMPWETSDLREQENAFVAFAQFGRWHPEICNAKLSKVDHQSQWMLARRLSWKVTGQKRYRKSPQSLKLDSAKLEPRSLMCNLP